MKPRRSANAFVEGKRKTANLILPKHHINPETLLSLSDDSSINLKAVPSTPML